MPGFEHVHIPVLSGAFGITMGQFFVCGQSVLWMDETLQHFETMRNHEKPLVVGIYSGVIIPGFLRWCEIDCVTPQKGGLMPFLPHSTMNTRRAHERYCGWTKSI